MPKYRVSRNPFNARDFVDVDAVSFTEEGSYTKFLDGEGAVALAIPTNMVTKIEELKES